MPLNGAQSKVNTKVVPFVLLANSNISIWEQAWTHLHRTQARVRLSRKLRRLSEGRSFLGALAQEEKKNFSSSSSTNLRSVKRTRLCGINRLRTTLTSPTRIHCPETDWSNRTQTRLPLFDLHATSQVEQAHQQAPTGRLTLLSDSNSRMRA